jgi:hypothetical protein
VKRIGLEGRKIKPVTSKANVMKVKPLLNLFLLAGLSGCGRHGGIYS